MNLSIVYVWPFSNTRKKLCWKLIMCNFCICLVVGIYPVLKRLHMFAVQQHWQIQFCCCCFFFFFLRGVAGFGGGGGGQQFELTDKNVPNCQERTFPPPPPIHHLAIWPSTDIIEIANDSILISLCNITD